MLTGGKKIIALSENGPIPDIDKEFDEAGNASVATRASDYASKYQVVKLVKLVTP